MLGAGLCCTALPLGAQPALQPLSPDQVLVVANVNHPYSVELARHYIDVRGIPDAQLITTGMGLAETVKRPEYERTIAGPIKDLIVANDMRHLRCVVLMYGVPLKVLEPPQTPAMRRLRVRIQEEQVDHLRRVAGIIARVEAMAGGKAAAQPPPVNPRGEFPAQRAQLNTQARQAFTGAANRLAAQDETDPAAVETWWNLWAEIYGFATPVDYRVDPPPGPPGPARPDHARRINRLLLNPLTLELFEEIMELAEQTYGTLGFVRLGEQLGRQLQPDWTHRASVDSELATLFWPPFPSDGSKPNPLHHSRLGLGRPPPTLMVCRLDGPDETIVRRMIDQALETERTGLRGTVYLDARGRSAQSAGYGQYDEDLRKLARMLDQATSLTVVLDDEEQIFQPGACPDTALYCGWYSLANYVDAFDFVPGAVAYHIASSEAVTLRKRPPRLWCPALLEDGVAATLGPVEEPFITAFPLPTEFFGLLLTGRWPLADCYYLTTPHVSWMMTLIGDPLYRPFAANPLLDADSLIPLPVLNNRMKNKEIRR